MFPVIRRHDVLSCLAGGEIADAYAKLTISRAVALGFIPMLAKLAREAMLFIPSEPKITVKGVLREIFCTVVLGVLVGEHS